MFIAFGRSGVVDEAVGADARGHTSARMTGRIEVIARVSGRRFWSVEQKLAMLRDAFGPGGSVRDAMERHEVTSGLLYTWRRNAMAGLLIDRPSKALALPAAEPGASFAEVSVADPIAVARLPSLASLPPAMSGKIAIELPSGIKLSVDASVDAEALGRVLSVLER
ncbi:transposase [Novosphingopyxis sp.]|uniref:transposase n=1 Tax=Novosphingopyxis sp. TaxID=2709690 RepID=UPI003B5C80A5